jgi:hypothetical protein
VEDFALWLPCCTGENPKGLDDARCIESVGHTLFAAYLQLINEKPRVNIEIPYALVGLFQRERRESVTSTLFH